MSAPDVPAGTSTLGSPERPREARLRGREGLDHRHLYAGPREALAAAARAAGVDPRIAHNDRHGWALWIEHFRHAEIDAVVDGLRLTGYDVDHGPGYMERVSIRGEQ